jgi:hypothetical protein
MMDKEAIREAKLIEARREAEKLLKYLDEIIDVYRKERIVYPSDLAHIEVWTTRIVRLIEEVAEVR